MLRSKHRYREMFGSAGPLAQSPVLLDFAFQFPPAKLLATRSQVGVRNRAQLSAQLGHPLFRGGAVLPNRFSSPWFCHVFIVWLILNAQQQARMHRPASAHCTMMPGTNTDTDPTVSVTMSSEK